MRRRIDLTVPTRWGDLTLPQLRTVVEVLLMTLTDEERLVLLFFRLAGVKTLGASRTPGSRLCVTADGKRFVIKDWELAAFGGLLRWVIDTEPDELPNPTGADDYLRDMTFGDWFETDTHIRLYEQDRDLSHFDTVVPKLEGAMRQVDELDAMMIRLWWVSLSSRFASMYPDAFECKTKGEGSSYNPFKSLQEIHLLLNDDHPQENGRIDDARLHDVLAALDSRIGKLKRRKSEMAGMRR